MIKTILVFMVACFIGLLIQATLVHSLSLSAPAPDFILVLVVYLSLRHSSVLGIVGAYCLGLAADFASGQFVGPNAAGMILAFSFVVAISQKVYAEHILAIAVVAFFSNIVKTLAQLIMMRIYVRTDLFEGGVFKLMLLESLLSAIVAPIVIFLLDWGTQSQPVRKIRGHARTS